MYCTQNCLFEWDYYKSYAMTMALPILVICLMLTRHYFFNYEANRVIRVFSTFTVVVYNGLTTKCLAVFMCTELVDGTQMLHASPDITCWENGHLALVGWSVFFFFLYVVGIPATIGTVLYRYKINNKLNDAEVMVKYSKLYGRYDPSYYWFAARWIQQHPISCS